MQALPDFYVSFIATVTMLLLIYYRAFGSAEFSTADWRLVFIKFYEKTTAET